jgi:superfamily II DNA or RNA helicase
LSDFDRQRLLDRLRELELERQQIQAQLRALPSDLSLFPAVAPRLGKPAVDQAPASTEAKVALFLDLFRCRADVYAKLWENQGTGAKGYVPAVQPEWWGKVGKKAGKGYDTLPPTAFLPLDESAAREHLEGKQTIGTYAIRRDDSCTFLAADFDEDHWIQDANAFVAAAREWGIDAPLERSRSGNGGHVWIFFDSPVAARSARRLGTLILARAAAGRSQMRLQSYDRFFPNQDTLPKGGFGNLIALPLQKAPRAAGNSVFVDDQLQPFPDPWAHLASIRRLSHGDLESLLTRFDAPVEAAPQDRGVADIRHAERVLDMGLDSKRPLEFEGRVLVGLGSGVTIKLDAAYPAGLVSAFKRTATLANPSFFERQRLRFSTWNTPRYIFCGDNLGTELWLPRGCLDDCLAWMAEAGAEVEAADSRSKGSRVALRFLGELDAVQKKAVQAVGPHEAGVLVAPPGIGKTVIGCALIARRKVNTLILVHRAPLVEQWRSRLGEFLGLKPKEVGILGGQRRRLTGKVDLVMIQSLAKLDPADPIFSAYGQVIVDECHHIPALSFESVLKRFTSRYVVGLTATPFRRDGLQKMLFMQCGPLRHEIPGGTGGDTERVVHFRESHFHLAETLGPQPPLHQVWEALTTDATRNELIAADVAAALGAGRFPLVLSERREHLQTLKARMEALAPQAQAFVLVGQMGKKERKKVLEDIDALAAAGGRPYLLATGSFIGEGFDLPALDTLFLAMPVAFKGKLIQYAGRLHRAHPGKSRVEIYDYVDTQLPLTMSMLRKRQKTYKFMGYLGLEAIHPPI